MTSFDAMDFLRGLGLAISRQDNGASMRPTEMTRTMRSFLTAPDSPATLTRMMSLRDQALREGYTLKRLDYSAVQTLQDVRDGLDRASKIAKK
jgi:hypothetical protein